MINTLPINKEVRAGYFIKSVDEADFNPSFLKYAKKYYDDETQVFFYQSLLNGADKNKLDRLEEGSKGLFKLRLAVFFQSEFVGWSYSRQEPTDSLYMQNSGIIPEHRKKGLYSCLVKETIAIATEMGFQSIWSLHRTTNNAVIIPKLRQGFIITGIEVSDSFGTRVRLSYYPTQIRRKIVDYRVGQIRADNEIKQHLGM